MDFLVSQSNLLQELQFAQGVVERKNTVPILSHLLLEAIGENLFITATDLDVSIRCASTANIKVSGSVALSARKLFDIARLLPELDIHFRTIEQGWLQIACANSRFKVATLTKENFPAVPVVNGETIPLPTKAVRHMVARSIFAITQEESRYTLNGALMILKGETLTIISTDGHRLVLIRRALEGVNVESERRVIVPKKTLVELSKLAGVDEPTIEFGSDENHLFFRAGERLLVSRILAGQFPNYEMVIPHENEKRITANTLDLTGALKRAAVMADDQSHAVRLFFKAGQLDISATSADIGEARETLTTDYEGDPLEIGFNAQYLLDFLTNLDSEEVVFEVRDTETQGLLKPKTAGDYLYNYVVMPMKL